MKKRKYTKVIAAGMMMILLLSSCTSEKKNEDQEITPTQTPIVEEKAIEIAGTPINANNTVYVVDKIFEEEQVAIDSVFFYSETILLVVMKDGTEATYVGLYDIEAAEFTKKVKVDNEAYIDQCLFCENGNILLNTSWANTFYYLDQDLNIIFDSSELTSGYTSIAAAEEGTYFYYIDTEERNLYKYDIATKEQSLVMEVDPALSNLTISQMTDDGRYIVSSYSDEDGYLQTVFLEPATKDVLYLEGVGSNVIVGQDNVYITDYEKTSNGFMEYFAIDNPRVLHKFYFDNKAEGNNFYVEADCGMLLSIKNNIDNAEEKNLLTLQLYNLNEGLLKRSTTVSRELLFAYEGYESEEADPVNDWFFYTPIGYGMNQEQTLAYFTYYVKGKTSILIWDLTAEQEEAKTQSGTAFYTNTEITKEDNDDYVEMLNEKYGVTIYIRNNVVRFFPDFAVNALYDEETTNEALKEVEKLLSRFPEGFFENMTYGNISGLEIYLCGTLVQGSDSGIQSPGGFALQYKGKQMIVMDATYPSGLVQSISHEIMHAIDSRLQYMVEELGEVDSSVYEQWNSLNPKKHGYRYSYVDKDGVEYNAYNNAKYTPLDEKSYEDVNNIYYIDYYANTYPIEDRARIFEYLMMADTELSYEFNSTHIKEKAELLCEMIRLAMPSIPEDDVMYWEKFIYTETE